MKLFKKLNLLAAFSLSLGTRPIDRGLNLPVTQGVTRDGAFFPGVYQMEYKPDQVSRAASHAGFSALRLPINVETAHSPEALQKHRKYLDSVGGHGIICLFDTSLVPGTSWPRYGNLTGKVDRVAQAWKQVHSFFASYGDAVLYEIFNEPWGYGSDATAYLKDMTTVIHLAGLPRDRVILAGLYGSADVQSVARAGWQGYLAYHVYVFWLPEGQRSRGQYAQKIQADLEGLSSRVFITEFGVGLDGNTADVERDEQEQDVIRYQGNTSAPSDWQLEHDESNASLKTICQKHPGNAWCKRHFSFSQAPNLGADVIAKTQHGSAAVAAQQPSMYQQDTMNFLRGMRDALLIFKKRGKGVRGLYHWHGWHNGDTWDFWDAANARSSRMIQMMMMDQYKGEQLKEEDDPYMSDDFPEDDAGAVNMVVARNLGAKSTAECPLECGYQHCLQGNEAQIGGKHLTGGFCTHNCSMRYGAKRYCGAGSGYQEGDAIDCGGCAKPARCFGLPCWAEVPLESEQAWAKHIARWTQDPAATKHISRLVPRAAFLQRDVASP